MAVSHSLIFIICVRQFDKTNTLGVNNILSKKKNRGLSGVYCSQTVVFIRQ